MCTFMPKVVLAVGFIVPRSHVTVRVALSWVQVTPGGVSRETNVVWSGMTRVTVVPFTALEAEVLTRYVYVRSESALGGFTAVAAMERPGRNEPKPSTYTWPQWPPCEQPAAMTSSSTVSPMDSCASPGATSTDCQSVYWMLPVVVFHGTPGWLAKLNV